MEDSQPFDSIQEIGFLKRVLFFVNVSTFKAVNAIPSVSNYRKNYHTGSFSFAIIVFTEFVILNFFAPQFANTYFKAIISVLSAFHGIIYIFFIKDVIRMSSNYNLYYNKSLFYLFFIFLAIGLVGFVVIFNNEIGHLK